MDVDFIMRLSRDASIDILCMTCDVRIGLTDQAGARLMECDWIMPYNPSLKIDTVLGIDPWDCGMSASFHDAAPSNSFILIIIRVRYLLIKAAAINVLCSIVIRYSLTYLDAVVKMNEHDKRAINVHL